MENIRFDDFNLIPCSPKGSPITSPRQQKAFSSPPMSPTVRRVMADHQERLSQPSLDRALQPLRPRSMHVGIAPGSAPFPSREAMAQFAPVDERPDGRTTRKVVLLQASSIYTKVWNTIKHYNDYDSIEWVRVSGAVYNQEMSTHLAFKQKLLVLGVLPKEEHVGQFKDLDVGAVLSMIEPFEYKSATLAGIPVKPEQWKAEGITHLLLPAGDFEAVPQEYIEQAVAFIKEQVDKNVRVYIHCKAGVGRSATVTIAYLMKEFGMEPGAAYDLVKASRPQINLNIKQMGALETYKRTLKQ